VSFLYPFFLIAGLSLAIPVLIHLFNLRRYKTVFFPHTRFLKNIQLNSRRQSQVRYKWLLLLRLLFLTLLILAFAQPYFANGDKKDTTNKTQVIYIDNSYSMTVKKGARNLLDIVKDAVHRQVQHALPGTRFLLITNDKPISYQPLPADKILTELNTLDVSPYSKTSDQLLSSVQSIMQTEGIHAVDLYCYSDFQAGSFAAPDTSLLKNISFYAVPVQADELNNVYIDTAYFTAPVLQIGQNNTIIVHSRAIGTLPKDMPVLQLQSNGKVMSAATLSFNDHNESIDTLTLRVNDGNWQHITLNINDAAVRFDDTFRIAARSAPNLSVLVLYEGQPNPYIQAAFRAYNGFKLNQVDTHNAPASWKEYNLIILSGITAINEALGKTIAAALQQGQSIAIFPGKTNDFTRLNEGLKLTGDIQINGIDTTTQAASTLQQGSEIVKDLFEKLPENIQLPVANWHYMINAGINTNQQSILSFRSGNPFLARYTPSKGKLYICATAADQQSGNFTASYFFVPFIYQMAIQAHSGDIYAITSGRQTPVYISLNNADERNMVHVYGNGTDMIPPQRPNAGGLDVFVDQTVRLPGFYPLSAKGSDTILVAMNADRQESLLDKRSLSDLKTAWKNGNIKWLELTDSGLLVKSRDWASFPLWKVCVILAIIMLVAETWLLTAKVPKPGIINA